jgi:hypothetical protein
VKQLLVPILACTTIIMLASCASVPASSPQADSTDAAPVARLSTTEVDQFALDLAAAVAEQNSVAYEAPSTVIDASVDGAQIGTVGLTDDPAGDADDFEELLSPTTESTMDSQADLQAETSDAIANADISVDEIVVGLQEPFSAVYTAVVAQDTTPVWYSLKV